MICYQCGNNGHQSKDCSFTEPSCFRCHGVGHVAAECPSSPSVQQRTPRQVRPAASARPAASVRPMPTIVAASSNQNGANASMWANEFASWQRASTNHCSVPAPAAAPAPASVPVAAPTPTVVNAWECVHCGGLNRVV